MLRETSAVRALRPSRCSRVVGEARGVGQRGHTRGEGGSRDVVRVRGRERVETVVVASGTVNEVNLVTLAQIDEVTHQAPSVRCSLSAGSCRSATRDRFGSRGG
jgi:hypothetical protein